MLECDQPVGGLGKGFGQLPASGTKKRSTGPSCGPKINLHPWEINSWNLKNDGLEDDLPFPGIYSQVRAVNLPGCK